MAKMTIFRHVANGRQGSPRFKGDPMDGWDELKPDRSYLSHFPPWYSKSGQFPIKNEKWPLGLSYGSIILQIVLWPYFTITHVVLTQLSDWTKKTILGHPRVHGLVSSTYETPCGSTMVWSVVCSWDTMGWIHLHTDGPWMVGRYCCPAETYTGLPSIYHTSP